MAGKAGHRGFGHVRRLPSKRWQASYVGPDQRRHKGPSTFQAKRDAEAWLSAEHALIASGAWQAPDVRKLQQAHTLGTYAEQWLAAREVRETTRAVYGRMMRRHILPALGGLPLEGITGGVVRDWYATLDASQPSARAQAYSLLRNILNSAVDEERIAVNPCRIRNAGSARRMLHIRPATLQELEVITAHMPEKYRPMVALATWCALRYGELTELRVRDVDLSGEVIRVRRAVTRAGGQFVVGPPKSDAGARDVAIPPHLVPMLREHRAAMPMRGRDALWFPGPDGASHLHRSTHHGMYKPAREAAGRPDLRWHDLRHTGAVLAAQTGATLAELMGRLGHTTPSVAMRYQHAAQGRDAQIAAALSKIAAGEG